MEMLEHLVKAREQGEAGPDGARANALRNEHDSKHKVGLEVGLDSHGNERG